MLCTCGSSQATQCIVMESVMCMSEWMEDPTGPTSISPNYSPGNGLAKIDNIHWAWSCVVISLIETYFIVNRRFLKLLLTLLFCILCVWVFCLHIHLCTTYMPGFSKDPQSATSRAPDRSSRIPFQPLTLGYFRWPSWINTTHRKLGSSSQQVGMCSCSTNGKLPWPSMNCVCHAD